jgi:hypothetical protein
MRLRRKRSLVLGLFAVLIPLGMVCPARGDQVLGFPNGLTGWSTYGDLGSVTAGGGLATINDMTSTYETDLYMSFTVPNGGAQSLQFTINFVSADSSYGGSGIPFFEAAFGVITPDMSGNNNPPAVAPLVPTVVLDGQTTDSFYELDVVTNPNSNSVSTAPGVTAPSWQVILGQVSVYLPSTLDGQSAGILFRLNGGTGGDTGSSVTISNVEIVPASAVPEPSSIISGLTAVCIAAGVLGTRSRRRAVTKTHRIAA